MWNADKDIFLKYVKFILKFTNFKVYIDIDWYIKMYRIDVCVCVTKDDAAWKHTCA